jgi:hypothetical protein
MVAGNFIFLPDKLNFCCGNYTLNETFEINSENKAARNVNNKKCFPKL